MEVIREMESVYSDEVLLGILSIYAKIDQLITWSFTIFVIPYQYPGALSTGLNPYLLVKASPLYAT
jgi:hypothetical protein